MSTIKIFLASSKELKSDRAAFKSFVADENKTLQKKGIFLDLEMWENYIDAMSQEGLQAEYNKTIQACDIFVVLFKTKVGKYTKEEFEKAFKQFQETNKPRVYTYFKNTSTKVGNLGQKDLESLWDFQKKLKDLKHYQTEYNNTDKLALYFRQQLDKLFPEIILPNNDNPIQISQIPKCLAAGQPSIPPEFVGRELELADIKQKLEKNNLLMLHAEGGMGKTTLAAKYLNDNLEKYKHYAWLFCENGITEQMKTLALPLHIDLAQYADEDSQLLAIKTAMQNLPKDCLLILDNANEAKHIDSFQKHFGGLQWHVLLTSRCQQVFSKDSEYTLDHLKPEQAKTLFKTYHDESAAEFEILLDKFLIAIGYNTLMIELFSKNLHELSAMGETLANTLDEFEKKGLFLNEKSFEIRTSWTGNVHKEAANTDQIIEALYDLTKLEESERKLLVNLALLPAESLLLTLLIDVLTPEDKIDFAKQLKALAQKGWLSTDSKSYRISPVIQQILLAKNKNTLLEDAINLISNLNKKLENDGGFSLVNLKTHAQAQPFAELANSVTNFLHDQTFEIGVLLLNLSDYYKAIGNFKASLEKLNEATDVFEKVNGENYSVCLDRLGDLYQQQGDFKRALQFFEQFNNLCRELFEANSHSESLKNRLAISYSKLGDIYQQQGDFKKALQFFEQYNNLCKELFEANPHSESLKKGLAISYSNLGDIYQQQGDYKKALQFFEQYNELSKELFEANSHNQSLKSGLAMSYEKLGDIYRQQEDFKKALQFFEKEKELFKELFDANPHSELLKNGLAISYQRIGRISLSQGNYLDAEANFKKYSELQFEIYQANPNSEKQKNDLAISYYNLGEVYEELSDFKNAQQFYEQSNYLFIELVGVNSQSILLYHRLASSYTSLGNMYDKIQQPKKVKEYFERAEEIWINLIEKVPEAVEFQNNLEWVQGELSSL